MTATRQQAGALVVAAVLSAAAASGALGGADAMVAQAAQAAQGSVEVAPALPELPKLPSSYTLPASVSPPIATSGALPVLFTGVTGDVADIPTAALATYQRAATVLAEVRESCGLDWQLLAAVAGVESDHGRVGGATVADDGTVHPAILGPALDGSAGIARVVDTDLGSLDGDATLDRAVGPFQFIPATWSAVAVDGDGDGVRDPQDFDDASLAAAVYLCAGHDDLSTEAGARDGLYAYNHSLSYVDRVLAARAGYLAASSVEDVLLARVALGGLQEVVEPVLSTPIGAGEAGDPDPTWDVPGSWFVPATPLPTVMVPTPTTPEPTTAPSAAPSSTPTTTISEEPEPTSDPTPDVDPDPTQDPAPDPTQDPGADPTADPTTAPTQVPTPVPVPTPEPTPAPPTVPTREPDPVPDPVPIRRQSFQAAGRIFEYEGLEGAVTVTTGDEVPAGAQPVDHPYDLTEAWVGTDPRSGDVSAWVRQQVEAQLVELSSPVLTLAQLITMIQSAP